jgi:hypothetical protein
MAMSWLVSDLIGKGVEASGAVEILPKVVGLGAALGPFFLWGRFAVFERELADIPRVDRTAGAVG